MDGVGGMGGVDGEVGGNLQEVDAVERVLARLVSEMAAEKHEMLLVSVCVCVCVFYFFSLSLSLFLFLSLSLSLSLSSMTHLCATYKNDTNVILCINMILMLSY